MIKVVVTSSPFSLTVSGHSGSADKGEDLICAAVSSIVTGGFNSLSNKEDFKEMTLESGHACLVAKGEISEHDKVVIETMITSLKTIRESYGKYLSITEKS